MCLFFMNVLMLNKFYVCEELFLDQNRSNVVEWTSRIGGFVVLDHEARRSPCVSTQVCGNRDKRPIKSIGNRGPRGFILRRVSHYSVIE